MQKEKTDSRERSKTFALRVVRMFSALPKTTEAQVLGKQLLRSGTSIGANYREAFRARSKAEWSDWGERHRRKSREVAESERATSESIHCEMRRFASRDRRMERVGSRDIDGKTREVAGELPGKQR